MKICQEKVPEYVTNFITNQRAGTLVAGLEGLNRIFTELISKVRYGTQ